MNSAAVAVIPPESSSAPLTVSSQPRFGLLRPVALPSEVIQAQEATRALVQEALKPGRDFGLIPGIDKPSLLKPGAERITLAFGCFARFRIVDQEVDHDRLVPWRKVKAIWDGPKGNRRKTGEDVATGESLGLYRYVVECEIVHRESGQVVAACIASCSTMESKYIDRPRDCENTALKMAEKRSFVGATLNAFGLSEQFTQDVEDLPRETVSHEGAADDDAVKCQKCQGAMWDNRAKNDEREKEGKKRMPDYKCKDAKCEAVIWDAKKFADELAAKEAAAKEGEQRPDPSGSTAPQNGDGSSTPVAPGSTSTSTAAASPSTAPESRGTETDATCPTCAGAMWNQATTKTHVRAPDFVCKNQQCEGKYWPGQWPPKSAATDAQVARLRALVGHDAIPKRTRTSVEGLLDAGMKQHRASEAIGKLERIIADYVPAGVVDSEDDGLPF